MNSHQRRVVRRRELRTRAFPAEFIRRAVRAVLPLAGIALLADPVGFPEALRLAVSVIDRPRS